MGHLVTGHTVGDGHGMGLGHVQVVVGYVARVGLLVREEDCRGNPWSPMRKRIKIFSKTYQKSSIMIF